VLWFRSAFFWILPIALLASDALALETFGAKQKQLYDQALKSDEELRAECLTEAKRKGDRQKFYACATPADLKEEFLGTRDDGARLEDVKWATPGKSYKVVINVDMTTQKLRFQVPGQAIDDVYTVKSASHKYRATERIAEATPERHCYEADAAVKNKFSKKYNGPMPFAVFFQGNLAIHTTGSGTLGTYSHGCIHLKRDDAEKVFNAVQQAGVENSVICLNGTSPPCLGLKGCLGADDSGDPERKGSTPPSAPVERPTRKPVLPEAPSI